MIPAGRPLLCASTLPYVPANNSPIASDNRIYRKQQSRKSKGVSDRYRSATVSRKYAVRQLGHLT